MVKDEFSFMGKSGEKAIFPTRTRSTNAVLDALAGVDAEISVARLCEITGLSRPTVMRTVRDLVTAGVATATTAEQANFAGGRRPQLFKLNRRHHASIVLRVNYHVMQGLAFDSAGSLLTRTAVKFSKSAKVPWLLREMLADLLGVVAVPVYSVAVVVMGIVRHGRVVRSDLVPELDDNQWISDLDRLLADSGQECSVVALNDAKISAQWMYYAVAQNKPAPESLIAIHCSEDVGCGLVFGGVLLDGAHGAAGEILQDINGPWTPVSKYLRQLEKEYGLPIRNVYKLRARDGGVAKFVEPLGQLMGKALVPMALTLDPDVITISGAIVDCGTELIDEIQKVLLAATPTAPEIRQTPYGAQSVEKGARMFVLKQAREKTLAISIENVNKSED